MPDGRGQPSFAGGTCPCRPKVAGHQAVAWPERHSVALPVESANLAALRGLREAWLCSRRRPSWRPCDSALIPFGRGHLSLRLQHKLNTLTDKRIRVVAVHSVVCVIDATGAVFLRKRPPISAIFTLSTLGLGLTMLESLSLRIVWGKQCHGGAGQACFARPVRSGFWPLRPRRPMPAASRSMSKVRMGRGLRSPASRRAARCHRCSGIPQR